MSKTVDVDLRIRAKNLSKSSLKDLTADVEKLAQAQSEQARSADLASRSMKDLLSEQQRAAALARELASRSGLLQRYVDEKAEIDSLAKKLVELTDLRKRAASAAASKGAFGVQLGGLDKSIVQTERALSSLTDRAGKTQARLHSVGVETADTSKSMREVSDAAQQATAAYETAVRNVNGYTAAVQRANAIQEEAIRRTKEEAQARAKVAAQNRSSIEAVGGRNRELASLRADIEERSRQAQAIAVTAEAQRRLNAEQSLQASSIAKNNAAVREAVQLLEQRRQRQAALEDVFGRQLTLQEREARAQTESNDRRQRLIALINSERGQRLLSIEAQRREASEAQRSAAAKSGLASATNRAAKEQQFFADTGRKSLSVYQRIRGQVLGLASAYVGIYQAINTVGEAIQAVNRNQALKIGLLTVNKGDAKAAAEDYRFLRQEADRLGLVFDDVAPKYANMAIAAKGVGVSAKDTKQLFTDIATAVSAGNLSLDDSEGVFRAIVQIMGKARVQAEELRGQLGDRLPGAVAAFAAANNIALTDLDKLMKSGQLGVDELIKFARGYAQQYAPVMEQATNRLQANINRARNAYNDWLRDLLNSSNQSKLKEAFKAIETFFNGRDGERFAEALGKAFKVVVDVFLFLADNIDLAAKALKVFIAVQVIKFGIDAANSIKSLALQMSSLGAASGAAGTNLGGAAASMGRLRLAATGIAGILLGIAAALDAQSTALNNASRDLNEYSSLLQRIGRQQGQARAASSEQAGQNVADIRKQLEKTESQSKRLQALLNEYNSGYVGKLTSSFKATFGTNGVRDLGVGPLTKVEEIQARINALNSQALNLRRSQTEEMEIQADLGVKELLQQAEEDKKLKTAAGESEAQRKARESAEKAAERARKSAEAAQQAAERQARAREAAEDAAAKKIIDLQDDIEKAKIETAARTDAQVQANYEATISRIDLDIKKKLLEVEALKRQTEAAGANNSDRFSTIDNLLPTLQAALKVRAEEDRVTAIVELRQKRINDLIDERNSKIELQKTLMETGQQGEIQTQSNINLLTDEYNAKINEQTQLFMAFLQTLDPEGDLWKRLGLDKVLRDMQLINAETVKLSDGQKFLNKWGQTIQQGFGEAFGTLAKGLAGAIQGANSFADAFKGARDAFLNFAADFLVQIAQMIVQALILQAIQNAINGTSGGYGQAVGNALFGSGHTGGVVGSRGTIGTNPRRSVSPSVFAGAQKFHQGGLPGLRKDEVAAIVKKGEEVVTPDNPRHISNAGADGGGSRPLDVTVVNTIDSASVVAQGWGGARRTVLNDISANKNAYRKAMGLP